MFLRLNLMIDDLDYFRRHSGRESEECVSHLEMGLKKFYFPPMTLIKSERNFP